MAIDRSWAQRTSFGPHRLRSVLGVGFATTFALLVAGTGCGDATESSAFTDGTGDDAGSSTGTGPIGTFGDTDAAVPTPTVPDASTAPDAANAVCGDGVLGGAEACDDGNTTAGDGCSSTCTVEPDWVCNVPGSPCARLGSCGDALLKAGEACDDGNGSGGDGCSATCQVESGWICPILGASCLAASCGDGILAGTEECDDGDTIDDNGCSNTCHVKDGFWCPTPGASCVATVCGDNQTRGTEQCDDGNVRPYDGCSPTCTKEPVCPKSGGVCQGACGDGIIFPGEQCDDGNTKSGDGCSATCTIESGFACSAVVQALPTTLTLPIVVRDFARGDQGGHPDFQTTNGAKTGMVGKLFDSSDLANIGTLDADGKPVLKCTTGLGDCRATSVDSFAQWYRDVPGDGTPGTRINYTFVRDLPLTLHGAGTSDPYYEFSNSYFFPIDGEGFGNQWNGSEGGGDHNFHFTSELRFWFYYDAAAPAPRFDFRGDDDVWVFVNGKLAVDIGGVHGASDGSLTLDASNATKLGLQSGQVYEFALFQAERRRSASNYRVTFRGFVNAKSSCASVCGDGIKTRFEACDQGAQNDTNDGGVPAYGKCSSDCKSRGPYCGDGNVDPSEACDDGVYNGGYGKCKADCSGPGPSCGDGVVQAAYGEVCDDGANNDVNVLPTPAAYGKCSSDCRSRPGCGDGIVQAPETCEPPNTATCSALCQTTSSGPN